MYIRERLTKHCFPIRLTRNLLSYNFTFRQTSSCLRMRRILFRCETDVLIGLKPKCLVKLTTRTSVVNRTLPSLIEEVRSVPVTSFSIIAGLLDVTVKLVY